MSAFLIYNGLKGLKITPYTIGGIIMFIFGLLYIKLYKLLDRKVGAIEGKIKKKLNCFEIGKEGEEIVAKELQNILKDGRIIRNFTLPEANFDFDIIAISSKGLFLFEVKNAKKQLIFDPDGFYVSNGNKLIPLPKEDDPRRQLTKQYYDLKEYLKSKGYENIKIFNAVVFAKKFSADIQRNAGTIVIVGTEYLKKRIDQMPDDPMFNPEFINKLASIFAK